MLWEETLEIHPELNYALEELHEGVLAAQTLSRVAAERAFRNLREDGLLFEVQDPETAPGGAYGYGLLFDDPGRPRPVVLVQSPLAPLAGSPIEVTAFASVHRRTTRVSWPNGTLAIGLPPPQQQAGSAVACAGMRVRVGSERATLGLAVAAPGIDRGYTTAGHAAPRAPVAVRDAAGGVIGTAVASRSLEATRPDVLTADIALVDLDDRTTDNGTPRAIRAARPREAVSLGNGPSSGRTWIRVLSPAMALRTDIGSWGQIAITADAISRAGDSGALVLGTDEAVVGHIVAGYEGVYSVVQDMEYCLTEVGAFLR